MLGELTKTLLYYVGGLSCLGVCLLFKRNFKRALVFSAFLFLCIFWRSFIRLTSSRYYSIILLYGIVLSVYFANAFIHAFHSKTAKHLVIFFFLATPFILHLILLFHSFRNTYIFDLQDSIKKTALNAPQYDIWVYKKEFNRLGYDLLQIKKNNYFEFISSPNNLTNDFLQCSYFNTKTYYVISESSSVQSPFSEQYSHYYKKIKIEHHNTNHNHSNFVSIYEFLSFNPLPQIDISKRFNSPIIKAFIPEYDAYIFQDGRKLFWLIGADIDRRTEIIFHIHTDRPELLPESRKKSGFDNRGFRVGYACERDRIGKYRVFEKDIPSEYPITCFRVGFNTEGAVVSRTFQLF